MPTIAGYLAACDRMVQGPYYYDNSGNRCNVNGYGRDCSTFVAFALAEAGYPGINLCNNSFGFAAQCYDQPRPDWFSARFGPGQGTFITHDQALHVVCWGLEGSNYARAATASGGGHIETSLGNGGGSVGAHSHATGIGYSPAPYGFDSHNVNYFAVPPQFLGEMTPAPPIDWATLVKLDHWRHRVIDADANGVHILRYGVRSDDVQIMNDLLVQRGFLAKSGNYYGPRSWIAVNAFKKANGWPPHTASISGRFFGGGAANAILK